MGNSSELFADDSLLHRFENVEDVFPQSVVTSQHGDTFHRQSLDEADPTPACNSNLTGVLEASVDDALLAGKTPCRICFEPIAEYLATREDSDVELRHGDRPTTVTVDGGTLELDPEPDRELKLTTMTEEVMIKRGRSKVMHVPTPSGTLCGRRGGYRTVERKAVEAHYRLCEDCFHHPAFED